MPPNELEGRWEHVTALGRTLNPASARKDCAATLPCPSTNAGQRGTRTRVTAPTPSSRCAGVPDRDTRPPWLEADRPAPPRTRQTAQTPVEAHAPTRNARPTPDHARTPGGTVPDSETPEPRNPGVPRGLRDPPPGGSPDRAASAGNWRHPTMEANQSTRCPLTLKGPFREIEKPSSPEIGNPSRQRRS